MSDEQERTWRFELGGFGADHRYGHEIARHRLMFTRVERPVVRAQNCLLLSRNITLHSRLVEYTRRLLNTFTHELATNDLSSTNAPVNVAPEDRQMQIFAIITDQ